MPRRSARRRSAHSCRYVFFAAAHSLDLTLWCLTLSHARCSRCPSPQHARSVLIIDNGRSFACIPLRGSQASLLTPLAVIFSSRSCATRPLSSARARIPGSLEMARGDNARGGFSDSRCPRRVSCTPLNGTRAPSPTLALHFHPSPYTLHATRYTLHPSPHTCHLAILRPRDDHCPIGVPRS